MTGIAVSARSHSWIHDSGKQPLPLRLLRACVADKYQLSHGFTNTKLYNLESRILVLPNI